LPYIKTKKEEPKQKLGFFFWRAGRDKALLMQIPIAWLTPSQFVAENLALRGFLYAPTLSGFESLTLKNKK